MWKRLWCIYSIIDEYVKFLIYVHMKWIWKAFISFLSLNFNILLNSMRILVSWIALERQTNLVKKRVARCKLYHLIQFIVHKFLLPWSLLRVRSKIVPSYAPLFGFKLPKRKITVSLQYFYVYNRNLCLTPFDSQCNDMEGMEIGFFCFKITVPKRSFSNTYL